MSQKLAFALTLALSAAAHDVHKHKRFPAPTIVERGPPYPTGPGYDVVPLESIVPLSPEYNQNTIPVPQNFPAGSQPPIPKAPLIPAFSLANTPWPQNWDLPPPTDSPQVKEWLKEIEGKAIPDIPLNKQVNGSNGVVCADNPSAVAKAGANGNCWWTCGGCVRDDDISTCKDKMTWGHTYDDGPGYYTNKLLTYLDSRDVKATFFLVGPRVISRPEVVVYEHMTGHELGVHTWSHPALTTLTNEQIVSELGWTREAIKQVTGVTPLLFRPPYGDIDDRVRAIARAMNLIPVLWTSIPDDDGDGDVEQWDSNDWRVHGGEFKAVENQKNFNATLDKSANLNTGVIVLQHDVYAETVDMAIGATVPQALARNPPFALKSVQVCQNEPIGNAYVETTTEALPETNAPSADPNNTTKGGSNSQNSQTSTGTGTGTRTGSNSPTNTSSSGAAVAQFNLNVVTPLVSLTALFLGSLML